MRRLGAAVVAATLMVGCAKDEAPKPAPRPSKPAITTFDGIPQSYTTLGRPDAPVTLVEFVDLQCPFCAVYSRNVLAGLVRRYVRTGKVKLELRILAFIGQDSRRGAAGAAVAARDDRAWQFATAFFASQGRENTGYANEAFLGRAAEGAGVDPGRVVAAAASGIRPPLVAESEGQAAASGIRGAPAFLIGPTNGRLRRLPLKSIQLEPFARAIDATARGR